MLVAGNELLSSWATSFGNAVPVTTYLFHHQLQFCFFGACSVGPPRPSAVLLKQLCATPLGAPQLTVTPELSKYTSHFSAKLYVSSLNPLYA